MDIRYLLFYSIELQNIVFSGSCRAGRCDFGGGSGGICGCQRISAWFWRIGCLDGHDFGLVRQKCRLYGEILQGEVGKAWRGGAEAFGQKQ